MGWVKDALSELAAGRHVHVLPFGGSMRGRIESGQLVTLAPTHGSEVQADDVVLVRWQGNYLLHLVKELGDGRLLIGNNLGKTNGWVSVDDVVAKVVALGERLEVVNQIGVVVNIRPAAFHCQVRLPSGEVVAAAIPKQIARDMFRVVIGDRVQVSGSIESKFKVLGFARDAVEPGGTSDRGGSE